MLKESVTIKEGKITRFKKVKEGIDYGVKW